MPQLTPRETGDFIHAARERVTKHNIHAIDTGRIRNEVEAIAAERRRESFSDEGFRKRMEAKYPYLSSKVPLLFEQAVEGDDLDDTLRRSEQILDVIDNARRLGQTPMECAVKAKETIMRS